MRRLWDRGHREEHNFVRILRGMGVEVRDYAERLLYHDASDCYVCVPWDKEDWGSEPLDDVHDIEMHQTRAFNRNEGPKQWAFALENGADVKDFEIVEKGHFGGACDAHLDETVAKWFPEIEGKGKGLGEFKTHNDKSFRELVKHGLMKSKPYHFIQCQQYMHFFGKKWTLYLAVNKNNDEVHEEIIHFQEETALAYAQRGVHLVSLRQAPMRVKEDPTWYQCKMCNYNGICHYNEPMEKSCRSCVFAEAVEGAEWRCHKFENIIPEDFIPQGCDKWEQLN